MKGKTFIIFGLGTASGFITGSTFVFHKIMKSDKMREAFSSILADKITDILFERDDVTARVSRPQSVRYRDFYDKPRRPSCYAVEGIVFDTKADAEKILEQMQEIIDTYGCVCIQDYYDLCNVSINHYREGKWGWTTLHGIEISQYKDGWHIDFPKAVPVS